MKCPECGEKMDYDGEWETMVGFYSPPNHDHNDNCLIRVYRCKNGHTIKLSKRRRCPNPDCDWIGKDECFCHPGKKLDEWPE